MADAFVLLTERRCQQRVALQNDVLDAPDGQDGEDLADHYGEISEQVYAFLKGQLFDVVHFQDWQGNGFASIQAFTAAVRLLSFSP